MGWALKFIISTFKGNLFATLFFGAPAAAGWMMLDSPKSGKLPISVSSHPPPTRITVLWAEYYAAAAASKPRKHYREIPPIILPAQAGAAAAAEDTPSQVNKWNPKESPKTTTTKLRRPRKKLEKQDDAGRTQESLEAITTTTTDYGAEKYSVSQATIRARGLLPARRSLPSTNFPDSTT